MADQKPTDTSEHPVAVANRIIEEENKKRSEYADSRTFVDDKRVSDGAPAPHVIADETIAANRGMVGSHGGNVGGEKAIDTSGAGGAGFAGDPATGSSKTSTK